MPLEKKLLVGQMLLDERVVTPEQLETGLREQKKNGSRICATLVRLGAPEDQVFSILSRQLNIPYVKLKTIPVTSELIQRIPVKVAAHYKVLPISFNDNILTVAMSEPQDLRILDDLRLLLNFEIKGALAYEVRIRDAIHAYYGVGADTLERILDSAAFTDSGNRRRRSVEDMESGVDDASIITFVNQIISEAVRARATDIHLEPYQDELRVRFRIDGMLYDVNISDSIRYFHAAIVSRVKIMAEMNITEQRFPQDGRMKIRLGEQELDIRVSVLPTVFGESVQIRILSGSGFLELGKLGLSDEGTSVVKTMIRKPNGIVFVTGPTGSGKSTTLYACLSDINSASVKIITIEDPVEYQIRGINQIQVQPAIGFTFAMALRHMLRHDPDVMMIGEVRDYETAEIAIRSALTGHLVFSTLHTNDAAGAITRLIDMGIEPFLVASSLECLIAQRLVRVICPKCKVPLKGVKLKAVIDSLGPEAEGRVFEGNGCDHCRNTGYFGRTAIYEILPVTEEIRSLIIRRSSSQEIKKKAMENGMRTLREDGLRKVYSGVTTFTEVIRVTQDSSW